MSAWLIPWLHEALRGWNAFALVYLGFVNTSYLVLTLFGFNYVRHHLKFSRLTDARLLFRSAATLKPVSILAPAYNEELTVVANVRSLLSLNYPDYEVILVNDGSRDGTLAALTEAYRLHALVRAPVERLPTQPVRAVFRSETHPNLLVIDKANGGKFDALNAGINYSRNPLFLAIDTDSLLERDVLLKLVRPFLERPETVAVGGIVRAVNGCQVRAGEVVDVRLPRSPLAIFQIIEYLRAFLFGRAGWAAANMLLVISGAFGIFQRAAVVAVGGYRHTVGEDMELIVRLHRHFLETRTPYHIDFAPEPVCWTEVPESLAMLGRQRNRWSRGLAEVLWMHRGMMFNPRYGRVGLVALPYQLAVEVLGASVEVLGLPFFFLAWYLGLLSEPFIVAFLAVSLLYGSVLSLSALVLEELSFRRYPRFGSVVMLFMLSLCESIGYHQLSTWWRMRGLIDYLRGKQGWGAMVRRGFGGSGGAPRT